MHTTTIARETYCATVYGIQTTRAGSNTDALQFANTDAPDALAAWWGRASIMADTDSRIYVDHVTTHGELLGDWWPGTAAMRDAAARAC